MNSMMPELGGTAPVTQDVEAVCAFVVRSVAAVLQLEMHDVQRGAQFAEIGFDSITLNALSSHLNASLGVDLLPPIFFEYTSPQMLAEYLVRMHAEELSSRGVLGVEPTLSNPEGTESIVARVAQAEPGIRPPSTCASRGRSPLLEERAEPVAVIGMSGCFPGAPDVHQFWRNLWEGVDCIGDVPPDRWDLEGLRRRDASLARKGIWQGGFIEGIAEFDPLFFGISPREAESLDPQHRLLLMHAWKAMEDAGYAAQRLSGTRTAVFVGTGDSGYWVPRDPAPSLGPNRLSYFLNLHGPSEPIETSCSSSLVAIHRAVLALNTDRCEAALAGGVNTIVSLGNHLGLSMSGMLNAEGRCRTFSAHAKGYVRGEGAGILMLKKLSDAERDRDQIYGVILASGQNHGGRANSLKAPNPKAHAQLLVDVYRRAGVDPRTVGYIEAHGTGTALGDPVEINGLKEAFARLYQLRGFGAAEQSHCGIGSVKTNIGHLELAAGVAGVIKVLLQMKHRALARSLHCEPANPYIDLRNTPFYIVKERGAWETILDTDSRELPRRAGVSSFGAGGVNAHVVIEEYVPAEAASEPTRRAGGPELIVLSAKNPERLKERAQQLLEATTPQQCAEISLESIAYTLQVGREPMEQRLAFTAHSVEELRERLTAYVDGRRELDGLYCGDVREQRDTMTLLNGDEQLTPVVMQWLERGKYGKALELWTKGLAIDWSRLYSGNEPRRLRLPTYPFARDKYWVPHKYRSSPTDAAGPTVGPGGCLHPLIHRNDSDFLQQRFTSVFDVTTPFVNDHMVRRAVVLPAVVYLEMAREALARASGRNPRDALQLSRIVWLRPLVIAATPVHVGTALELESSGEMRFEIYTTNSGAGGDIEGDRNTSSEVGASWWCNADDSVEVTDRLVFCRGYARWIEASAIPDGRREVGQLADGTTLREFSAAQCYESFERMGIAYGPTYRALRRVVVKVGEANGPLALAYIERSSDSLEGVVLDPGMLDAALQATFALADSGNAAASVATRLPFALDQVEIYRPTPARAVAVLRESEDSSAALSKQDVDLCDEEGRVCARLTGFTSRAAEGKRGAEGMLLLERRWLQQPLETQENGVADRAAGAGPRRWVLIEQMPCADDFRRHCQGVSVELLRNSGADLAERFRGYAGQILHRIQELIRSRPKEPQLVQVVLARASGEENVLGALSALLKTAAQESPKLIGQVIEVLPHEMASDLARKVSESAGRLADSEIRYEDELRYVAGYVELPESTTTSPSAGAEHRPMPWRDGGVYLIAGGAGGLGAVFATEIMSQVRDAQVIMVGRSALSTARVEQLRALESRGGRIEYRQFDVADESSVQHGIAELERTYGRLNGLIHLAGVLQDNFLINKTAAELESVLRPKVAGTVNLDRATQRQSLDFFLLCSSVVGVFGNVGQADYALANAFLDHFARYREGLRRRGLRSGRTLSIDWPLWESGAMHVDEATRKRMELSGFGALRKAEGLHALYRAWLGESEQTVVLTGDLQRIRATLRTVPTDSEQRADGLARAPVAEPAGMAAAVGDTSLIQKIQTAVIQSVSKLLKVSSAEIDIGAELNEFGFDSITLTELANALNETYDLRLTPTIFFEYSTVRGFSQFLATEHAAPLAAKLQPRGTVQPSPPQSKQAARASVARSPVNSRHGRFALVKSAAGHDEKDEPEPIAIIGMSGCFPGAADLDAFWENLQSERDCISEIPPERWDWRALYGDPNREPNKTNIRWGGFIECIAEFDPLFFGISPREAETMDPQQRLLMSFAWKALEDAGYCAQSLSGSNTAIFVGTSSSGYGDLIAQANLPTEGYSTTGVVPSLGPNRLSYFLNVHGPSEPIETSCSSSLVAIHRAVRAIRGGDCQMAVVGGINTIIGPAGHIGLGKAGMLSEDGRCKTFSREANGYVRGEGVGMLVLKPLAAARADRDHIYALIRGSSENHGGRANSLTAPNPRAQAELIKAAYKEAAIDPRTVSYIEAHGTGTSLGDPIEIDALKTAFRDLYQESGAGPVQAHCGVGSVKTNIGHLELAAGVAGVIKVVLQMKHGKLVKSLHCREVNPYIQLAGSPFYIVQETTSWARLGEDIGKGLPRRAGVSSFGFGGVNAHVVLEEYLEEQRGELERHVGTEPRVIVLSAKNEARLREQTQLLLGAVQDGGLSDADLADIAYTLQVGREALEYRLGFTASSLQELARALTRFIEEKPLIAGRQPLEALYCGEVKKHKDALSVFASEVELQQVVESWIQHGRYDKLLEFWVQGLTLDWRKLYPGATPGRISLPTYPFARERYWVSGTVPAPALWEMSADFVS